MKHAANCFKIRPINYNTASLSAKEYLQSSVIVGAPFCIFYVAHRWCLYDGALPASFAHLRMEVTSLPLVVLHWDRTAAALTPTVPSLALTPQRKAVAVPALSATCALVLYVCGVTNQVQAVKCQVPNTSVFCHPYMLVIVVCVI